MTAPASEQVSGGVAFATPGDWFPLRVPRERADAEELTRQILTARPGLAPDGVARMARSLADACAALDVLCAYTTVLEVPGGPLPATVLASVHPMGDLDVERLAERMSGGGQPTCFSLPAGRTARIERLREQPIPGRDERLVSLVVQYVTAIPGTGDAVVLTFSTPALGLGDQLRQLFHQMACTLRFEPADEAADAEDRR
jgi:hypothetical protein